MALALPTVKGDKGEGVAEFLNWQATSRALPFLRRNLRQAFKTLATSSPLMGSLLSRPKTSRPHETLDDDEDENPRPAKRRKTGGYGEVIQSRSANATFISPFERSSTEGTRRQLSMSIDAGAPRNQTLLESSSLAVSSNPNLGGRPAMRRKKFTSINEILPEEPERSLRIDIMGFQYSEDFEPSRTSRDHIDQTSYKCRCTIAVFTTENENSAEQTELYRLSQRGTIRTSYEGSGNSARVSLPGPFIIPVENLYVNRRGESYLSDNYRLHVWFKSDGFQKNWPPMDTGSLAQQNGLPNVMKEEFATLNDLWLFCSTKSLLDPNRQNSPLELSLGCGTRNKKWEKVRTPYSLDIGIRWSLPRLLRSMNTKHQTSDPAPAPFIDTSTVKACPVTMDQENTDVLNESPRRAHRRRTETATYNLKVLSDIARGDQPKSYRPRGARSSERAVDQEGGVNIIYSLGRADAADLGMSQKIAVGGFTCLICCDDHGSLDELKSHFIIQHSHFNFHLRHSSKIQFFIELAFKAGSVEQARTIQLNRPFTLFDLERFLNGDKSWAKARQGPQHNRWPKNMADRFRSSSSSSSPSVSRQSSPNTSLDMPNDISHLDPRSILSAKRPGNVRVPKTIRPLYHPVTKRQLIPGEAIDNSDDENDEGWLHQKHRDIIMDYTNITDSEKDYVNRWNPFITSLKLTCDKYMPHILIRFVSENVLWFLCEDSRPREFCKHTEALMLRGTIEYECWVECMEILKKAANEISKEKIEEARKAEIPIWDPSTKRGFMDCICGLPVNAIDSLNRVLCSGSNCRDPFFHPQCIKEALIDEKGEISNYEELRNWKCNACMATHDEEGLPRYAGSLF